MGYVATLNIFILLVPKLKEVYTIMGLTCFVYVGDNIVLEG